MDLPGCLGRTFKPINNRKGKSNGFPFGFAVHVIRNSPDNHEVLFAGTDLGVYRSVDGGDSWSRFGQGLPMVAVTDLYLAPDGKLIRAATYGRGVWEAPLK